MSTLSDMVDAEKLRRAWRWLKSNPDATYKHYCRDLHRTFAIAEDALLDDLADRSKRDVYTPSHSSKLYFPSRKGCLPDTLDWPLVCISTRHVSLRDPLGEESAYLLSGPSPTSARPKKAFRTPLSKSLTSPVNGAIPSRIPCPPTMQPSSPIPLSSQGSTSLASSPSELFRPTTQAPLRGRCRTRWQRARGGRN